MSQHFVAVSTVRGALSTLLQQPRGDFAERLSSDFTCGILILLSAVLLTSHYWGEPIQCWVPAQYTQWWVAFVNNYCYVHGTYYVPLSTPLSWDVSERRQLPVNYYQWVPYVLAVQGILFYAPRLVWRGLCGVSGIDASSTITSIESVWRQAQSCEGNFDARIHKFESHAVPLFWDALRLQRRRPWYRPSLFTCYVMVKFCHLFNASMQWFWLNSFLSSRRYTYWGVQILRDLLLGYDWQHTGHFPRITHCDFSQRKSGSFNLESVLCVLTLNVYYEKIFLFLWFWLLFVVIVTAVSACSWLYLYCFTTADKIMVRRFLSSTESAELIYHTEAFSAVQTAPLSTTYAPTPLLCTLDKGVSTEQRPLETFSIEVDSSQQHPVPTMGLAGLSLRHIAKETNHKEESEHLRPFIASTPYYAASEQHHKKVTNKCTDIEFQLFTERYLKNDGMFLLRQSSVALGDLPTAYMCRALYTSVLDPNRAPAYTLHSPSASSSTKSAKLYATLMRRKDA